MGLLKLAARFVLRHELRRADLELARAAMRQDQWKQHAIGLEAFCAAHIGKGWMEDYATHFSKLERDRMGSK